ncbi:MAG: hypothetical protein JNM17_24240 [Archangium sp.]|nr:hypothetical protein [Archangium sp.]
MGFVEAVQQALGHTADAPALASLEQRMRAAHPSLVWDLESLAAFVALRLEGAAASAITALRASDLLLAWACLVRQPAALEIFERDVMPQVRRAVRGIDSSPAFVDETANATRTRLLLGEGDRKPGLELYQATGPLAAFAMVVAMRLGADRVRSVAPGHALELALDLTDEVRSAETLLGAAELRPRVKAALRRAAEVLSPRERALLKLHLLEGVPAQKLAQMYRVHRATATRWINDARQKVLERMTDELQRELDVGPDSFARLKSDLLDGFELTLSGVLSSAEPA